MTQAQVAIDEESLTLLDSTAAASTFSREEALKEAIVNYAEYDRWFRAKVEEGRLAYRNGDICSNEDVEYDAELRRSELLERLRNAK